MTPEEKLEELAADAARHAASRTKSPEKGPPTWPARPPPTKTDVGFGTSSVRWASADEGALADDSYAQEARHILSGQPRKTRTHLGPTPGVVRFAEPSSRLG